MTTDDKLTRIADDISEIKISQAEMKRDIAHHIKRSDAADENLKLLRDEIKPIKKHVNMMEGGLKLLGIVSLLVGIAVGIAKLLTP